MEIKLLLLILLAVSSVSAQGRLVGGKTEVKNVESNREIQQLGRFCVEEYNRKVGSSSRQRLVFSEVIEAQTQVVSGIKYYLKIKASTSPPGTTTSTTTRVFDSVLVVKPWLHSKQLLHFGPSTATVNPFFFL